MTHRMVKLGLPLLLALAAACTTMGTGFGSTASGADPVTFSWKKIRFGFRNHERSADRRQ